MWTKVNQVYTTRHSQNCWAHLEATNKWHKVVTGATDGATNVFLILCAAKGNDRQAHVVLDDSDQIDRVYM